MKIKLVIFDIDGTIVDAYGAIHESLSYTLEKLGYPKATAYQARRAVGHGDKGFIKTFVKPRHVKDALEIYRRHHEKSLLKYSKVLPGARRLLNSMHREGFKLAVASNRPPKFSKILLRHLGLARYFDAILCAKDMTETKPKPVLLLKILKKLKMRRDETIYIGDMSIDMRAGKRAGVRTIAILGGSSNRSELKKEKPYAIISRLDQIFKCCMAI